MPRSVPDVVPRTEPSVSVSASAGDRRCVLRALMESGVCLLLAVILFRMFVAEGYVISTGSMAPHLLGFHKCVECPTCRYPFRFGVAYDTDGTGDHAAALEASPDRQVAQCPNCGQAGIDLLAVPRNHGDQLLVFKPAFDLQRPQRWEVVVFRNPHNPLEAYVKRVVGLPGEQIQIIDGDLYADGSLCRKSWDEQCQLRIPVHVHRYRPVAPVEPSSSDPSSSPNGSADDAASTGIDQDPSLNPNGGNEDWSTDEQAQSSADGELVGGVGSEELVTASGVAAAADRSRNGVGWADHALTDPSVAQSSTIGAARGRRTGHLSSDGLASSKAASANEQPLSGPAWRAIPAALGQPRWLSEGDRFVLKCSEAAVSGHCVTGSEDSSPADASSLEDMPEDASDPTVSRSKNHRGVSSELDGHRHTSGQSHPVDESGTLGEAGPTPAAAADRLHWAWAEFVNWRATGGQHVTSVPLVSWPAEIDASKIPPAGLRYSAETQQLSCVGVLSESVAERLWQASDRGEYRRAVRTLAEASHVVPINDDYGYNPAAENGSNTAMRDIAVSLRLTCQAQSGEFAIEMNDGSANYTWVIDVSRREFRLYAANQPDPVEVAAWSDEVTERWLQGQALQLEMSLFDQQVIAVVNGQSVLTPWMFATPDGIAPSRYPVRFGARGLDAIVDEITLYRDVYYTGVRARHGVQRPYALASDEYFVLGDNSPLSHDSRRWSDGAVQDSLLIGKPFVVHLPSRPGRLRLGQWDLQLRIPDWQRMRLLQRPRH
jgi:signal peptidase I